jgi:hypothetical protein
MSAPVAVSATAGSANLLELAALVGIEEGAGFEPLVPFRGICHSKERRSMSSDPCRNTALLKAGLEVRIRLPPAKSLRTSVPERRTGRRENNGARMENGNLTQVPLSLSWTPKMRQVAKVEPCP